MQQRGEQTRLAQRCTTGNYSSLGGARGKYKKGVTPREAGLELRDMSQIWAEGETDIARMEANDGEMCKWK